VYPWEEYVSPNPRADPFNYDDSGTYMGPTVEGEPAPYRAGTLGNSGYDTSGPPTAGVHPGAVKRVRLSRGTTQAACLLP
jgi:hypothetical protein